VEVMCLAGNGGWENSIFQKRWSRCSSALVKAVSVQTKTGAGFQKELENTGEFTYFGVLLQNLREKENKLREKPNKVTTGELFAHAWDFCPYYLHSQPVEVVFLPSPCHSFGKWLSRISPSFLLHHLFPQTRLSWSIMQFCNDLLLVFLPLPQLSFSTPTLIPIHLPCSWQNVLFIPQILSCHSTTQH
jgi:hypothetical protein